MPIKNRHLKFHFCEVSEEAILQEILCYICDKIFFKIWPLYNHWFIGSWQVTAAFIPSIAYFSVFEVQEFLLMVIRFSQLMMISAEIIRFFYSTGMPKTGGLA